MKIQTRRLNLFFYWSAAMLLLAGAALARADESTESRISITSQGLAIERGDVGNGNLSNDEYEPLQSAGSREKSTRGKEQHKSLVTDSEATASSPNTDFWIYDASVVLFSDFDRDGYYFGIDLEFDADTIYSVADVYAVLYLSHDYGPWNEYASTEDFAIFGASGGDEYVVETELVSGYVTGDYDILIELFDAFDGTYIASFGPDDSSELSYLPLEDAGRDTPPGTTIVVNNGGGGSLSLLGLLVLIGAVGLARIRAIRP